jgi:hypothetical protein
MSEPTIGSVTYPSGNPSGLEKIIPFLKFTWINFGVILPMLLAVFFFALLSENFRRKYPWTLHMALTAVLFFALVQLIRFQPWDYDNNKLLVFFQFFAAPALVAFFIWLMEHKKTLGASALIVFFLLGTHSGFMDIIPRLLVPEKRSPVIFDKNAVALADYVRKNIKPNEMILTGSTHLNPISSLAGRPVLVGYPGWLWTRGLDYSKRENDIKSFYADPEKKNFVLDLYNVKHILLDPQTTIDWKADKTLFDKSFQIEFASPNYNLYKVQF